MKQYKHKQTGIIVTENKDGLFTTTFGGTTFQKWVFDNSQDWELIKEQPFKNGDVVKINSSCGSAIILITDYDNLKGYGFINGVWGTSYAFEFTKWTLATKEEWLEALTKEAVKRGLIEGKKITSLFAGLESEAIGNPYLNSDNQLWIKGKSKNLLIMDNGIWAEVIKEETLEELAEKYLKNYNCTYDSFTKIFINFFNENKPTINRLSK